jgi:hypothetical protein
MVQFNKNFKHDLEFGEIREQKVADIFLNEKIEVKTERDTWFTTGNIAIEIKYRNEDSGLRTTESKYWMHILDYNGQQFCTLMFEVATLRKLVNELLDQEKAVIKMGGDDKQSTLVLIPISKIFTVANQI